MWLRLPYKLAHFNFPIYSKVNLYFIKLYSFVIRPIADSHTMPMETLAGMPLLFKWRTSSLHHPQWLWAVYQFSSLFKFKRLPSHLVWLIQHLLEPLLLIDLALLSEALTNSRSLPGVEEIVQRKHMALAIDILLLKLMFNCRQITFIMVVNQL